MSAHDGGLPLRTIRLSGYRVGGSLVIPITNATAELFGLVNNFPESNLFRNSSVRSLEDSIAASSSLSHSAAIPLLRGDDLTRWRKRFDLLISNIFLTKVPERYGLIVP